jgi:hypothetical protein
MGNKGIYIAEFENGIHRVAIVEEVDLDDLDDDKVKEMFLHGKAFDDETTAQLYALRLKEINDNQYGIFEVMVILPDVFNVSVEEEIVEEVKEEVIEQTLEEGEQTMLAKKEKRVVIIENPKEIEDVCYFNIIRPNETHYSVFVGGDHIANIHPKDVDGVQDLINFANRYIYSIATNTIPPMEEKPANQEMVNEVNSEAI